jgi:hypothetical protein
MSVKLIEMIRAATAYERSKLLAVLSAMTPGVFMSSRKRLRSVDNRQPKAFSISLKASYRKTSNRIIINHKSKNTEK